MKIFQAASLALIGFIGFGAACAEASTPPSTEPIAETTEVPEPIPDLVLDGPGGQPVTIDSYCGLIDLAMETYGDSVRCNKQDPNLPLYEAMYVQIMENDPGSLYAFSERFQFADYAYWELPVVPAEDMAFGVFACASRAEFSYEFFFDARIEEMTIDGVKAAWQLSGDILCPWLLETASGGTLPDSSFTIIFTSAWGEDFMVTCGELASTPVGYSGESCSSELQAYFNSFPDTNPHGFYTFGSSEVGNLVISAFQGGTTTLSSYPTLMANLGLNACFAERVEGTGLVGFSDYLFSHSLGFADGDTELFFNAALAELCPN